MKIYGSGIIYDTFVIFNVEDQKYISQIETSEEIYVIQRNFRPHKYHLKLWPRSPGIFPMGQTSHGNRLYWMVQEDSDINGFAIFDPKSPRYLYYEDAFSVFLLECIDRNLPYIHKRDLLSSEKFCITPVSD